MQNLSIDLSVLDQSKCLGHIEDFIEKELGDYNVHKFSINLGGLNCELFTRQDHEKTATVICVPLYVYACPSMYAARSVVERWKDAHWVVRGQILMLAKSQEVDINDSDEKKQDDWLEWITSFITECTRAGVLAFEQPIPVKVEEAIKSEAINNMVEDLKQELRYLEGLNEGLIQGYTKGLHELGFQLCTIIEKLATK